MIKKIFVVCLLLLSASICSAEERIELYAGEIKILKLGNIERIAIGNPEVLSNSMLNNGQLLLIAEDAGSSEVHIWFADGSESDYMVHVTAQDNNLVSRKNEVEGLLSDIEGLEVSIVGEKIILSGIVAEGHEDAVMVVAEGFEEVMNNLNFAINTLVKKKLEVEDMLSDIGGLKVRIVGENIVLSGEIESGYEEAIETVQGAIPEVMNLTRTGALDMTDPDNKMVVMNIKFTEFNKNYTDTIGIAWDNSFTGPSAGVSAIAGRGDNLETPLTTPLNFANSLVGTNSGSIGYFGIATEIASRVNLIVSSGNALILAEPRLSVRSGGTASFLAGGEFPIEISNINGTTVEFKEFGIGLTISPTVDTDNNVRANVETELSSIDDSVTINGVPGLLSRKTSADVLLRSGETLVMSGLMNQEASKTVDGIKFLSEIPILGALFRSEKFIDKKTELVIFVTPTVFDANSEINKRAIEYAKEGIQSIIDAIDEDSLDIIH